MSDRVRSLVSVIVVCFNARQHLETCLSSVALQTYPNLEVVVVDNGSTDGSVEYVRHNFPSFHLVENGANLGYARANNVGFQAAKGELFAVLNPDTEVHSRWVTALVEAFDDPAVGLATSRVCYFGDRSRINACGNRVHVSGIGYCRGLDEPAGKYDEPAWVASVSGCSFMIQRSLIDRIGGFDEDFFMYVEDTDLSLRAQLAGARIRYVPGSIVYHKYALRPTARKLYLLERNRSQVLLKNFRWLTLAALSPSILATWLLMWLYALIHGPAYLAAQFRAQLWLVRNWRPLMDKRATVQSLRRVNDSQLVELLDDRMPIEQLVANPTLVRLFRRPINAFYGVLSLPARMLVR
jgi:hypothetical protein